MRSGLVIEAVKVADLGASEWARWETLRAANPLLASPYFDPRYARIAGRFAHGAEIAVIQRAGRIDGFLPFQRRGASIQALAAPVTDFHGVIAAPNAAIDLSDVARGLGVERFSVRGLVASGEGQTRGLVEERAMSSDLSQGFAAYEAGRASGFMKDKRRRRRALERDHGPLSFSFASPSAEALDWVIAGKRAQLKRTHQFDIFECRWTSRLLHALAEAAEDDFGLRLAVLKAGDKIVAAELGLRGGERHHLWFPIYDTAFARYSPGALMTLETLRAAAELGVARVDFGSGEGTYKQDYADPMEPVFEGMVCARGAQASALRRLPGMGKAARRMELVSACVPGAAGYVRGASSLVGAMGRRHPGIGAGLGLGVGLGLSLALLAE